MQTTESSLVNAGSNSSLKPDFFIVGAAKAGTTSLYHYLASHPDVYMSPVKEPHHFATDINIENLREKVKKALKHQNTEKFITTGMHGTLHRAYIRDRELYLKLFSKAEKGKLKGEASPSNLFSTTAAQEIFNFNPQAKIIIILRNPVERAYSHYLMDRRIGFTNGSFSEALLQDEKAAHKTWGATSNYISLGMYFEQVKRYFAVFPSEQILVILLEDLKRDPAKMMKEIFRFLSINENYQPDFSTKHNEAIIPRNAIMNRLLNISFLREFLSSKLKNSPVKKSIKKLFFTSPSEEKKDVETLEKLKTIYKPDIEKLSVLLNRDLSEWS